MGSSGGQSSWAYKETAWLLEGHKQPLYCGAFNHFNPKLLGDLFATVGGNRATIYRCRPGGELQPVQVYVNKDTSEEFYAVAWSVDTANGAPLLLLAGKHGLLLVVNPLTGTLETCFEGHGLAINDIAVHPTRPQFVATASRDQSLRLWNLRTKCCVLVFQGDGGHRNEVLSLSWKPGPQSLLASAGMDNFIKIWSLEPQERTLAASDEWQPGEQVFPATLVTVPTFSTERVHWNYVDCVRWLGDYVLSKSVDNTIAIWRPDTSTPQHARDGDVELLQAGVLQLEDCGQVWWLRFALDYWCTTLAIGTNRGKVLVFDPHAVQPHPKARLRARRSQNKEQRAPLVRQTAVSYDGSIIVACHEDGSVTRYDRCEARPGSAAATKSEQEGQQGRRPGSADGGGSGRGSESRHTSGVTSGSSGSDDSGSSSNGSSGSSSSGSEDEQE
ncbi:hypothetical protein ABPG77_004621 [Micractinium sp. CCAP 211/92]